MKSSAQNRILNTLSKTLPDDRPVTGIQIVEDIEKCPNGFVVISRTHDQDQDADLWRDSSFFTRKHGRYLCISKTEGLPNYIVQQITIVSDKEMPPDGFSVLHRTVDSEQKAWRKKQLCYKLSNVKNTAQAVTDIIVCSRMKKAPSGFTFAGEINGMTICYKMGNLDSVLKNNIQNGGLPFPSLGTPPERPPKPAPPPPKINSQPLIDDGNHDYERLLPSYLQPSRPAPKPPQNNYNTLAVYHGLEGIPFVLNPKLSSTGIFEKFQIPAIKPRSLYQINKDYEYDFTAERQT